MTSDRRRTVTREIDARAAGSAYDRATWTQIIPNRLRHPSPRRSTQPETVEAIRLAGRARIVRRSINLTPFGGHFCEFCLPLETVELDAPDPETAR